MGRQLVSVEIEVHPRLAGPALATSKQLAVKGARRREVLDGEGVVEGAIQHKEKRAFKA
jgi:hypothetical protein